MIAHNNKQPVLFGLIEKCVDIGNVKNGREIESSGAIISYIFVVVK